ncbi:ABC transporter ATP-binding protein [Rhizobium alvei]|uniref:ABC transporter ATP-binding protein n=1 Tax=Rhizobium alvei TaxID=1132659 RepID=A0ABT8YRB8_9HYPH|nr:ABC transporter ATP-binding protein [Rhizobium alvei]MDO6966164.1 ABC transporter ATP-binding protein [Rhizobium alvei]
MSQSSPEIALSLKDVRKRFGPVEIIRGVNLDIRKGERHALIGPNGAGKSTLFHLISGRLQASSGTISLNDRQIQQMRPADICRAGLSRSFQITNVFKKLTVIENLRSAVFWRLGYKYSLFRMVSGLSDVEQLCEELLHQIGLEHRRDSQADVLSYAEQRALELGLAIAGGADVLLLDEPMAGMSHSETHHALELIKRVSQGKTLLMVEHDMGVIFDLADRISVLVYGQVIATGTPEEIRANERVKEAYLGTSMDELKKEVSA